MTVGRSLLKNSANDSEKSEGVARQSAPKRLQISKTTIGSNTRSIVFESIGKRDILDVMHLAHEHSQSRLDTACDDRRLEPSKKNARAIAYSRFQTGRALLVGRELPVGRALLVGVPSAARNMISASSTVRVRKPM